MQTLAHGPGPHHGSRNYVERMDQPRWMTSTM
jgi:hypothetical protein